MTYPKDENGRYFIPSQEGETRIEADCASCRSGWNVPERVWDWFSFCHAREHRKGHNGLAALADVNVRRFEPGKAAQPEPEAAG
jgi:hypothetical protein